MFDRRNSYVRSAVHTANHINRTKYLLTFITILCTITAVFLIRVNLSENGSISTIAKTIFWLLNSTSGFFLIAYPWWLTTRNSFLYYKRLQWSCIGVALIVYVLVCSRTLLAPVEHINNTDPSITSLSFRIVSLLYWVAILGGCFIFMPFMIRRRRLFNSSRTQLALAFFVLPCVLMAFSSVVLQEWSGNGYLLSSSPIILIVLYYAVKIAHALFNEPEENGVEFNEAYIIVAGFVPFWLGSTLGKSLLEVINQGDVFGTIVIVTFWRVVIWIFEVMCAEIGRKATRMSDEAIFSFCAIYTGAVYAEFIFLSVEFNSRQFYMLLLLEFGTIVFWQGGRIIDVQEWIVRYVPSNWVLGQKFKAIWLVVIGEMPGEIAERCSHFSGTNNPPDVALSLIRSRAVVVQITWAQNDIKMASELQSLACATCAVAADMIFSAFDIGVDFITVPSKQELFYIYLANLFVIIVAQAIAQYEIKSKVKALKRDVTKVVQAMTSSAKKRISGEQQQKLNSFTHSDPSRNNGKRNSSIDYSSTTEVEETERNGGNNNEKRMSRQDSVETTEEDREDCTAYNPLAGLREKKEEKDQSGLKKETQRRSSIVDLIGNALSSVKEQVVDTSANVGVGVGVGGDDNNDHFLDLQDILDITEEINDDGASYATRGRKSSSNVSFQYQYTSPVFEDSKHDFGDEYSFLEKENHLNAGYLMKNKNINAVSVPVYQRKYFILTPTMLFFYEKESDVSVSSGHIAGVEGKIYMKEVDRIVQDLSSTLKFSLVLRSGVTYEFQAYTAKEADVWFSQFSLIISNGDKGNSGTKDNKNNDSSSKSNALVDDYDCNFVDRRRQNISAYRRSSLGGIPAIVNHLKFPTKSELPSKHGYLEKFNNLFWQKRYFTLYQPGVLCWYGSERDANSDVAMKNSVQLERILSVMQSDEDTCCFDIDVRGRTYHLKALSSGLAEEWCECLSAWSSFLFLTNNNKRGSAASASTTTTTTTRVSRSASGQRYSSLPVSSQKENNTENSHSHSHNHNHSRPNLNTDTDHHYNNTTDHDRMRTDSNISGLTETSTSNGVANHIELSTIAIPLTDNNTNTTTNNNSTRYNATAAANGGGGGDRSSGKRWSISTFNSLDSRSPEKKQCAVMLKSSSLFSLLSKWKRGRALIVTPGVLRIMNMNEVSTILLESINLWDVLSVDIAENEEDSFECYCLEITLKGRNVVLRLPTPEERDSWVLCLTSWARTDSLDLTVDVSDESPLDEGGEERVGAGNGINGGGEFTTHAHIEGKRKKRASFFELTMEKLGQHNSVINGKNGSVGVGKKGQYERLDSFTLTNSSQISSCGEILNQTVMFDKEVSSDDHNDDEIEEKEEKEETPSDLSVVLEGDDGTDTQNKTEEGEGNEEEEEEEEGEEEWMKQARHLKQTTSTGNNNTKNTKTNDSLADGSDFALLSAERESTEIRPFSGLSRFFRRLSAGTSAQNQSEVKVKQQRKSVLSELLHLSSSSSGGGGGGKVSSPHGHKKDSGDKEDEREKGNDNNNNKNDNDNDNIDDDDDDEVEDLMPSRLKSNSIFKNDYTDDQFVAKVCERSLIRRQSKLPSAWAGGASSSTGGVGDKGKARQQMSMRRMSSSVSRQQQQHHQQRQQQYPNEKASDHHNIHDQQSGSYKMVDDGNDIPRSRAESTSANQTFMERNTNTDQDDFVNKLKTRSYHEMNREFWHRHRWYLTAVVCYVTMHVLSVTSYMIRETSFEQE